MSHSNITYAKETLNLLGYAVYTGELNQIELKQRPLVINTLNPHSYCVALQDEEFAHALKSADILLPDGIGIVYAARILEKKKIRRIPGSDLHDFMITEAHKKNLSVFYLGSHEATLVRIGSRLKELFPDLRFGYYSPPYTDAFSLEDNEAMVRTVQAFKPDILFVGMTAPKQEKWVFSNMEELQAGVICSIGAVFDFFAGTVRRPGKFWIERGLEWFPRFIKEPTRLWRRVLVSGPYFMYHVIITKLFR